MTVVNFNNISGINSITAQGNSLNFYTIDGNTLSIGASVSGNITGNVTGNVTGNINSTGVSTVTTLRSTSIVGVNTIGIAQTAYISSINDGALSGARNRIINGDCRIDQRNSGAVVSSVGAGSTFIIDRWSVYSGLGGVFRAGQTLNNVSPPPGFSHYFGVQNIATSSSNVNTLQQNIEGFNLADFDFGKSTAKPITLSFWMYSSVAGLHGGTFMNYAQTRIYPFSWNYTSANTWQYVTLTIPGDTSGTWVGSTNAGAASFIFCLGGGTAFFSGTPGVWISSSGGGTYGVVGQVNLANTSNATFYFTGIQLEQGTVATPFERRPFGQELALCQRYCEVFKAPNNEPYGSLYCSSTTTARGILKYQVTKRASTSVTLTAANTFLVQSNNGGGLNNYVPSAISATAIGVDSCLFDATCSGLIHGYGGNLLGGATSSQIIVSSEL